jgi:hypothetical protein
MAVDIVGSHLKSQTGRGQNNDQTGSFTREKSLPIIPNVAPPNAIADAGDWQTRKIDASPIKAHGGMKNRSTLVEKIPSPTIRRDSGKTLLKP